MARPTPEERAESLWRGGGIGRGRVSDIAAEIRRVEKDSVRKTSVSGKDYVLHLSDGELTACGRRTSGVNCAGGDFEPDEAICRSCLRARKIHNSGPDICAERLFRGGDIARSRVEAIAAEIREAELLAKKDARRPKKKETAR